VHARVEMTQRHVANLAIIAAIIDRKDRSSELKFGGSLE
jgi:hypothetical protein